MGHFTSADPKMISRQRMFDPQQWNMYSYTRNNPLKFIDPDGRELKIIIVNSSSFSDKVMQSVGNEIANKARNAGVKNVSVEVSHSPVKSEAESLLSTHVHSIEFGAKGSTTAPINESKDIPGQTSGVDPRVTPGHTISAVDTNSTTGKDINESVEQMANVGAHELGHDTKKEEGTGGAGDVMDTVTMKGDKQFTSDDAQTLRDTYNRPDEQEQNSSDADHPEEQPNENPTTS